MVAPDTFRAVSTVLSLTHKKCPPAHTLRFAGKIYSEFWVFFMATLHPPGALEYAPKFLKKICGLPIQAVWKQGSWDFRPCVRVTLARHHCNQTADFNETWKNFT